MRCKASGLRQPSRARAKCTDPGPVLGPPCSCFVNARATSSNCCGGTARAYACLPSDWRRGASSGRRPTVAPCRSRRHSCCTQRQFHWRTACALPGINAQFDRCNRNGALNRPRPAQCFGGPSRTGSAVRSPFPGRRPCPSPEIRIFLAKNRFLGKYSFSQ